MKDGIQKSIKDATELFNNMPLKQKEIALRFIENKMLGRTKENEKIYEQACKDAGMGN